jgi:hypothetical protein
MWRAPGASGVVRAQWRWALGFALALVSGNTLLRWLTRTVTFLSAVIGLAPSSLLWFWLFDRQVGLFNKALVEQGLLEKLPVWFKKVDTALVAVSLSVVWKLVGFGMILLLLALSLLASQRPLAKTSMIPPSYLQSSLSFDNYTKVASYQQSNWIYLRNSVLVAGLLIAMCLGDTVGLAINAERALMFGADISRLVKSGKR